MEQEKKRNVVVEQITGIFVPIINYLTAASIIKSVIVVLGNAGILSLQSGVYRIFYGVSDGFFYFLPFFLAYTASKQWHTDRLLSMMIPAAMLYPDILEVLENGGSMSFGGIPVNSAIYHSSVLPVLMAVGLLKFVEKPCDRLIPEAVRGFVKPILCCAVVLPVTFLLFGPIGTWIGDYLTELFFLIYHWNPVVAGAFMGFLIQPMVVVGAHWSIVPICINSIATVGYDVILPLLGGAVYGQCGAALALGILYKGQQEKRRMAFQGAFSAAIGVTEPTLFGVTVPQIRGMLAACIGGAVGGAIAGIGGTHCTTFAFPSFLTCIAYIGPGFVWFLISMAVSFLVGFLLTMVQRKWIR